MDNVTKFLKEDGKNILAEFANISSKRQREKYPNATVLEISEGQYNLALNYLKVIVETNLMFLQAAGATKANLYEAKKAISAGLKKLSDAVLTDEFYSYEENMKPEK